jgi:hypothetical protein
MSKLHAVRSESPKWPPGGAALAKRDGHIVLLVPPAATPKQVKGAQKWAASKLKELQNERQA